jgi:hypothetical protein
MKHILVTRASFEDDNLFKKYYEVMKDVYIPSVANQTNKDFTLYLIVNEQHKKLLEDEFLKYGLKIETIVGKAKQYTYYIRKNPIEIQTRHDCDDWMAPTYMEEIRANCEEKAKTSDAFLVQAQPKKMDYFTKREYDMHPYHETRVSMFVSLYQKNGTISILEHSHTQFYTLVPTVYSLNDGLVKWVIHGNNTEGTITDLDIRRYK